MPYVYYQHPAGNITIARVTEPAEEGDTPVMRWKFSAETLETSPALLAAMQDLPMIGGLEDPEPLSPYFRLREQVRAASPALVGKRGYLELWQWLGLAFAFAVAGGLVPVISIVLKRLSRMSKRLEGLATLAVPTGLAVATILLQVALLRLGITQAGLPLLGTVIGVSLVITLAVFLYRLATAIGAWTHERARKTTTYIDEIATSLGTGLVKLLVVIGAVIAIADVVGLPYEGVLTGLGVGGVALAFAARDTVSNIMGGGLLMADRPFNRGDLIEIDGKLATVEEVGLRSTQLRAVDDTLMHVPNLQLSDRIMINWGRRRRRKVTLMVGVTYDTPREKLDDFARRMRNMLQEHDRVDPADIYVGLTGFGASSIDYEVLCHLLVFDYGAQVKAQHELVVGIMAIAEELGVEFAFPTRTVHVAGMKQAPRAETVTVPPIAKPETA